MSMILYLRRADENQVAALQAKPDQLADFLFADGAEKRGDLIDFDKAWHALHFVLTGSAGGTDHALSILVNVGGEFGVDLGYGPCRLISPAAMRAFSEALAGISDDDLRARYDPMAMEREQVYLSDMFVEEGNEAWDYIIQGLPNLRRFADVCVESSASAIAVLN